jgi:acyl-CoA thioester hydrolase
MPAIYLHTLTVAEAEIDRWGHVNNRVYLNWMEQAAVEHSSVNGWPPERYEQIGQGWVARSHTIEYHKPAFVGDEVVVRTWIGGFRRVTSIRRYSVERYADGAVLATAETNWAFVNLATFAPARIPPEVAICFPVPAGE